MKLIPRLQQIRKSKGLLQNFVANQLGIKQQQLSEWEKGKTFPRIDKAYRLAEILEVSIEELYEVCNDNENQV